MPSRDSIKKLDQIIQVRTNQVLEGGRFEDVGLTVARTSMPKRPWLSYSRESTQLP
jgi:hypothetical protein